MTDLSDRLGRIEEVVDGIAQQQEVNTVAIAELHASTQENTEAIAANTEAIFDLKEKTISCEISKEVNNNSNLKLFKIG